MARRILFHRLLLGVVMTALLALPAAAGADSIVLTAPDNNIYLTTADGSGQWRVTNSGGWVSPSQADDGTIAAHGNDDRLHRMNHHGVELNAPVDPALPPGEGLDSLNDPVISPDGTKIAYWYIIESGYFDRDCNCERTTGSTEWVVTDSDAFTPESKYDAGGAFVQPSWIDNGRLLVTNTFGAYPLKNVATDTVVANKASWEEGHAQWFSDKSESRVTLSDGEMTRDFKQMAFVGDEKSIHFYTVNGFPADVPETDSGSVYDPVPPDRNPPTATCKVDFDAKVGYLSWSPDGTRLAFELGGKGVVVMGAPNPETCAGDPATLIVPGGHAPDWGPADAPAARDPDPDPVPDPTGPALTALRLTPARFSTGHGGGTKISYTVSELAAVAFVFERVLPGRRAGKRCVAPTKRNRGAQRCKRYKELAGGIVKRAEAGANSFKFNGRLKNRALTPGSYRLSALAVNADQQQSDLVQRGFKVVR